MSRKEIALALLADRTIAPWHRKLLEFVRDVPIARVIIDVPPRNGYRLFIREMRRPMRQFNWAVMYGRKLAVRRLEDL